MHTQGKGDLQEKLEEMFREITSLEAELRAFIENTLKKVYSHNWIKQAIPKAIRDDWQQKRESDVKQGKLPETDLINYADFSHYKDIIIHNWKIFAEFFEDKERVRIKLEDLNNLCRIVTMHTRTLDNDEMGATRVAIRWVRSKIQGSPGEKKEATGEVEDIHPIFIANPFMVEEGATYVSGEKRPSADTLKRIDLHLLDSSGKHLFAEIKWTSVDEKQVTEYKKLISRQMKNFRLMWILPDDLASAKSRIKKLGAEVKVFSRKEMLELVAIRKAATESLLEIREILTKPFDDTIHGETITFVDVIRACYFEGVLEVEGKPKKVGLKQSGIGRYLDLIRSISVSSYAGILPELTLELIREILVAPYSFREGRLYMVAKKGFKSIPEFSHIRRSLSAIIDAVWKYADDFNSRYKTRLRALYGNDPHKYDLTYRVMEIAAARKGNMLDVKTLVTNLIDAFDLAPLPPTPRIVHSTLNQPVHNITETSGYENDFAKRIIEIATLKRMLIPKPGITIMWVLAPRSHEGKIEPDRVPCQSFIFNADQTLYREVN
jgi:hypothetical protein